MEAKCSSRLNKWRDISFYLYLISHLPKGAIPNQPINHQKKKKKKKKGLAQARLRRINTAASCLSGCSLHQRRIHTGTIFFSLLFKLKRESVSCMTSGKQFLKLTILMRKESWKQFVLVSKVFGYRELPITESTRIFSEYPKTTACWKEISLCFINKD